MKVPDSRPDQHSDDRSNTWRGEAEAALAELTSSGRTFTADDLRKVVSCEPPHPNLVGRLFSLARDRGEIVEIGHTRSTVTSRHAGHLRIWIGVGVDNDSVGAA